MQAESSCTKRFAICRTLQHCPGCQCSRPAVPTPGASCGARCASMMCLACARAVVPTLPAAQLGCAPAASDAHCSRGCGQAGGQQTFECLQKSPTAVEPTGLMQAKTMKVAGQRACSAHAQQRRQRRGRTRAHFPLVLLSPVLACITVSRGDSPACCCLRSSSAAARAAADAGDASSRASRLATSAALHSSCASCSEGSRLRRSKVCSASWQSMASSRFAASLPGAGAAACTQGPALAGCWARRACRNLLPPWRGN